MSILISIPDDCKSLADAVTQLVTSVERTHRRTENGRAVEYAQIERELGERTAAVERAAHDSILAALDIDAPAVMMNSRLHTRVHRAEGRYYTLAGEVVRGAGRGRGLGFPTANVRSEREPLVPLGVYACRATVAIVTSISV